MDSNFLIKNEEIDKYNNFKKQNILAFFNRFNI